jgi:hypothetical protein
MYVSEINVKNNSTEINLLDWNPCCSKIGFVISNQTAIIVNTQNQNCGVPEDFYRSMCYKYSFTRKWKRTKRRSF